MTDDELAATIKRNLGDQPQRKGWNPTAGPDAPPELVEYLKTRTAMYDTTNDSPEAIRGYHGFSVFLANAGPIEHLGYKYTISDRGIGIAQV